MAACSAYGCTNRPSKKSPGITFHKFPLDPKRRAVWARAVGRKNWVPNNYSVLCSEHFAEMYMDRTSTVVVRLTSDAVPTIFKAHPPHLQKLVETIAKEFGRDQTPVVESLPVATGASEVDPTMECSQEINSKSPSAANDSEQDCESGNHVNSFAQTHADDENSLTDCSSATVDNESIMNSYDNSHVQSGMQSDIGKSYLQTIFDLRAQLQLCHNRRIQDRKKIKVLQQTVRRCRKKIASLERMLDERYKDFAIDDDDDSLDMLEDSLEENEMFTIIHVGQDQLDAHNT